MATTKKKKKKPASKARTVKAHKMTDGGNKAKCNQDKICDWLQGTATTRAFAVPLNYQFPVPMPKPAKNDAWTAHVQYMIQQLMTAVAALEDIVICKNPVPPGMQPVIGPQCGSGGGENPPPPPPSYPPN